MLKKRAVALISRKYKSQDIEEDKEQKKKMSKIHNTRAKSRETKSSSKEEKLALEPSSSICSEMNSTSTDWAKILECENTVYITNVLSTDAKNFATSNKDNSTALSMESDELSHNLQEGATSLNKSTNKKANINTKNNNALMFDIQCLKDISINEIVAMLYSKIGTDFISAKPHFVKGTYSYLELIFAKNIRLRKVSIAKREEISKEIQEVFRNIGTILAIKPLLYEGTPIQSDQWVVKAPKLCFFCNGKGHLKKDCEQLKATKILNQYYKQFKENKNKRVEITKTINNKLALEGNTGEERLNENTLVPNLQNSLPMDTDMEMKATELSDEAETKQIVINNIHTTKSLIQSELKNTISNPGGSVSKESNDTQKVECRANQDDEDFTEVKNNKKKRRKVNLGTTNNH
ncbi:1305_t:CDS:2 [Dentiscutata erythropus]|uniref:1305_t:CDS:1 n=1 Tax=Dentiscutata erythropus TaxID=1348616 RepID=A0A9N9NEF3_9GLOM|nr:1305_t:CDS:2 [Dentiscutata erythropus]